MTVVGVRVFMVEVRVSDEANMLFFSPAGRPKRPVLLLVMDESGAISSLAEDTAPESVSVSMMKWRGQRKGTL